MRATLMRGALRGNPSRSHPKQSEVARLESRTRNEKLSRSRELLQKVQDLTRESRKRKEMSLEAPATVKACPS